MTRPELLPDAPLHGGMLLPSDVALPPVPLEQTVITVDVAGPLAETSVVQRFRNSHTAPLDALYVFPLPAEAAVSAFELHIGDRIIRGELRPRPEAEAVFHAAAERGAAAALLAQERPNLFSVELANLQPAEVIEARLRFFHQVPFDDGWFALSIPTVVLPRYVPAGESARPQDGVVPLLAEGQPGHTLSLRVCLDVGRLAEVQAVGFALEIEEARGCTIATLRAPGAVPDRDLVLRYRPLGDGYSAVSFSYRQAGRPGAALILLTPRAVPEPDEILPRELLFVFDRSGSMGGESIAQARNALRACLRALNPGDSFNIFPFDNHVERLASAPLPFTQQSIDAADAFIDGINARGGTEIAGAIMAALAQPRDPARLRMVVFLTDGAVGNEDHVLRTLAGQLNEARVFAFGVGSAVNRFLLDRLATLGRGSVEYILPGEPIEPAVQHFQRRAALPLIRDLSVAWGGAAVDEVLPDPLPDLYAGQPLVVLARYQAPRDQSVTITVRGRTARGSFTETLPVDLPLATPDRQGAWAALPKLWARMRLAALEDAARLDRSRAAALDAEARDLALAYGLLSAHTAFVAVEEPPPDAQGRRATARVVVPVHLPFGTQRGAFEVDTGLLGGSPRALYAMAMPSAASRPRRDAAPRQAIGGVAAKFLGALRNDLARADEPGAPVPTPVPFSVLTTLPASQAHTPVARRDAALRFLARTQEVSGAWAGDEQTTALVALAFALAGHTARSGDFRPQLARTAHWLKALAAPGASATLALHALAGEPVAEAAITDLANAVVHELEQTRAQLEAAQRLGGDADGAVLDAGADHQRPTPGVLQRTAVLALLAS